MGPRQFLCLLAMRVREKITQHNTQVYSICSIEIAKKREERGKNWREIEKIYKCMWYKWFERLYVVHEWFFVNSFIFSFVLFVISKFCWRFLSLSFSPILSYLVSIVFAFGMSNTRRIRTKAWEAQERYKKKMVLCKKNDKLNVWNVMEFSPKQWRKKHTNTHTIFLFLSHRIRNNTMFNSKTLSSLRIRQHRSYGRHTNTNEREREKEKKTQRFQTVWQSQNR